MLIAEENITKFEKELKQNKETNSLSFWKGLGKG